ncbi:hypothetical protein BST95_10510 [Halioglobus japonicus]|uniref:Uncharacterized protein n=1 Tax=Halioglobus japonicus TaxID=930805 RepID=A0AAP8SNH4_9GAMM|nr:hypothetical protein [Halioglobus japonicus]AQA18603.1 hypothetical protein BST95_10510 [Halioglobus japonicus]PLW86627.1 hypothetical protein C0029_09540 [Halioglobus japonicus]GHD11885.1 hypothetical protein GCM10007052_12120 [Halioglobus japonicus]
MHGNAQQVCFAGMVLIAMRLTAVVLMTGASIDGAWSGRLVAAYTAHLGQAAGMITTCRASGKGHVGDPVIRFIVGYVCRESFVEVPAKRIDTIASAHEAVFPVASV